MDKQGERDLSLMLMRTPLRWPLWPLLTVKKRSDDGSRSTPGVMRTYNNGDPAEPAVVEMRLPTLGNPDDQVKAWDEAPKHVYDTLEDVVADGWVADY